ncbi:MAG: hypothetical protein HQ568_00220 [Calditrichaeota bacterium]|nr:hypothetical protein [Calditrichota bacterium]
MIETAEEIIQKPRQYIVDEKGDRVGIVLDIETYRQMMELLEDAFDVQLINETLGEPTIPWAKVKKSLRQEGKL